MINNVFGMAKKINDSFSHVHCLKKIIICTLQITTVLYLRIFFLFNFIKIMFNPANYYLPQLNNSFLKDNYSIAAN